MFNRRQIMNAAWERCRRYSQPFAQCLRLAWYDAKRAAARYNVIGQRIGTEDEIIASGVNYERAGELEWFNKCRFDNIVICAA